MDLDVKNIKLLYYNKKFFLKHLIIIEDIS